LNDQEPDHTTKLSFVIALKQRNLQELENRFSRISNPMHPDYSTHQWDPDLLKFIGYFFFSSHPEMYMTTGQIADLIAPSEENILRVLMWLQANNVIDYEVARTRDLIQFKTDARNAEQLLNVDFQRFKNIFSGATVVRAVDRYSVPEDVAQYIELISGVHGFRRADIKPMRTADKISNLKADAPLSGITPAVIRKEFNVPDGLQGKSSSNLQAIGSFLKQYVSPQDLTLFQKKNSLPAQRIAKIVGPNDASNPGMEAQLDIEYITGLAPLVPTWVVSFGDLHENQEPFLEWAQYVTTARELFVYIFC
jgi:tripeptidyl-peptidase I